MEDVEARIESQDGSEAHEEGEFLTNQIEGYRKESLIRFYVASIHEKWSKEHPDKQALFDKEFQHEYIAFRMRLAGFVRANRKFLEDPSLDNLEAIKASAAFIDPTLVLPTYEYEKYMQETEQIKVILSGDSNDGIFKQLTGRDSPSGIYNLENHGNCLVITCYDDEDYFALWDSKKVKKTGGFFMHQKKINYNGSEVDVPLIAVRGESKPELQDAFHEHYADEFREYMEEWYQEENNEEARDEETGEEASGYPEWEEKNRKIGWDRFLLDKLERGEFHSEGLSDEDEGAALAHLFNLNLITDHEKQHHTYERTVIEHYELETRIETERDLDEYFEELLNNFLIRVGDELIAYMREAEDKAYNFADFISMDGFDKDTYDKEEWSKLRLDRKEDIKNMNKILKIRLSNALYFYPRDHRSETLKELEDKLGRDKFKQWKVAERYDDQVIKKFVKYKKRLEAIASDLMRHTVLKGRERIIDLLEVESVAHWPMIHRWLRTNDSLNYLINQE